MAERTGPVVRASLPAVPCSSLPFGPDLWGLWGEDPGDTGHAAASAVSREAAQAAGPTELWGMGCEESILGSGMFQSRGVVSKRLVDAGRLPRGAGPRSHVTVLTGYGYTLWTLVKTPWRPQAARAEDPLDCRRITAG